MNLIKKKAITPGTRHQLLVDKSYLKKPLKIKYLIKRKKNNSGRNNTGTIVNRHRGGSHKRKMMRHLAWPTNSANSKSIVVGINYDSQRSSLIASAFDLENKKFFFVNALKNLYPGAIIQNNIQKGEVNIGNKTFLTYIPAGTILSSVGLDKPIYARSAGSSCQLLQKTRTSIKIRIPSGEVKFLKPIAKATIGAISNDKHNLQVFGKAGKQRLKNIRPRVRGVAMNPIDHPHGGGGGRPSVSPWGKPTKGQKTRRKNK